MAVMETAMPKKRDEPAPQGQSAKIPPDVLQMARTIVAVRGGSVTKLIGDYCRPHFAKIVQGMIERGELLPPKAD